MRRRLTTLVVLAATLASTTATAKPSPEEIEELPEWQTNPDGIRLDLIRHFLDNGDATSALQIIRLLRDEGSKDPLLDLHQGRALRMEGLFHEAERQLDSARKRMPRNGEIYKELCILYADDGRTDDAVNACERSVKFAPRDASTWNNLGFLHLSLGNSEEAVESLEKAVDIDAIQARFRNNLALAQVADGHPERALRTFLSTSSRADAHYNVAAALERESDVTHAREWYYRALDIEPNHELASVALQRLQRPSLETP